MERFPWGNRFLAYTEIPAKQKRFGKVQRQLALCSAHQQAIIRAMGGTTSQVVRLYFRLGMCLVCLGLAGGLILGHGLYYCLSSLLQSRAGLYLPQLLAAEEGVLVVGFLLLGALCSWLPAYLTDLRSDIVENL